MTDTKAPEELTTLEKLFFEIGEEIAKSIASCKTPAEQQLLLEAILKKLEKENYDICESTLDEQAEIRLQLKRYYKKGLVRWGRAQTKMLITDETVMKQGKLIAYDEESENHEEFPIPPNLAEAFHHGWTDRKKKEAA
jgi:hypothetical protein